MHKLLHKLKTLDQSFLKKRLIGYTAIITLVFFILYSISSLIYILYFKNKLIQQNSTVVSTQATAVLDSILVEVYSTSATFINNRAIKNFINYSYDFESSFEATRIISEAQQIIISQMLIAINIKNIYVYSTKSHYVISNLTGGSNNLFTGSSWYQKIHEHPEYSFYAYTDEVDSKLYFIQKCESGYIIISLDTALINDYVSTENFFIGIDDTKCIVYATNHSKDWISENEPAFYEIRTIDYSPGVLKQNDMLILKTKSKYWFSYGFIYQMSTINKNIGYITIILTSGAILILLMLYISLRQINQIRSYATQITALFNSDFENPEKEYNEWVFIANKVANLQNENTQFIDEMALRLKNLKKFQGIALQSQLNQHFLFNTLYMANLSIYNQIHGECAGTIMITKLSELLKIILNTKENIIKFSLELEYTKKYIELEQIKYEKTLEVLIDISKECEEFTLPKLLLQPIIENSIIHGMRQDKVLCIKLSAKIENNRLLIVIYDNGAGIERIKLSELKESLNAKEQPEKGNIGLWNLVNRLNLYYDNNYEFTIDSVEGEFTSITLALYPLRSDSGST